MSNEPSQTAGEPAAPHANYRRQAAEHFGAAAAPVPPPKPNAPKIFRAGQPAPRPVGATTEQPSAQSSADTTGSDTPHRTTDTPRIFRNAGDDTTARTGPGSNDRGAAAQGRSDPAPPDSTQPISGTPRIFHAPADTTARIEAGTDDNDTTTQMIRPGTTDSTQRTAMHDTQRDSARSERAATAPAHPVADEQRHAEFFRQTAEHFAAGSQHAEPGSTDRPSPADTAPSPPSPLMAAAVLVALLAVLAIRWLVLPPALILLLLILEIAAAVGYVLYRGQNPDKAADVEDRVTQRVAASANRILAGASAVVSSAGNSASRPRRQTQWPSAPLVGSFLPGDAPRTARTQTPGDDVGVRDAMISAALIVPSLIAFGAVYNIKTFDSPWQPWWIFMALNAYFVVCVALRARTDGRRAPAALLALSAAAVYGFVTSPSPVWGLGALLQTAMTNGAISWSDSSTYLLWASRVPALVIILYVAAWGLARRRNAAWGLGLAVTVVLVSLTTWYGETHWHPALGWFGLWLAEVGVLVLGCMVCWILDALSTPKQPHPTPWAGPQ